MSSCTRVATRDFLPARKPSTGYRLHRYCLSAVGRRGRFRGDTREHCRGIYRSTTCNTRNQTNQTKPNQSHAVAFHSCARASAAAIGQARAESARTFKVRRAQVALQCRMRLARGPPAGAQCAEAPAATHPTVGACAHGWLAPARALLIDVESHERCYTRFPARAKALYRVPRLHRKLLWARLVAAVDFMAVLGSTCVVLQVG